MMMVGRKFSATGSYSFGFNSKENDNEVKGEGNQLDYGMRIYDSRIGRFLSVDPLTKQFPWYSPYHVSGGNPITNVDLDGGEPKDYRDDWIYTTISPALGGKSEWTAFDQNSELGWISYEAVFDKVSKCHWFIHQSSSDDFFYWKHNPGADQLIYRSGINANGTWVKFTPISSPNPANLLRTIIITPIVALPAIVVYGIPIVNVLAKIANEKLKQSKNQKPLPSEQQKPVEPYAPKEPLPRNEHGEAVPSSEFPHTQLGTTHGRKGPYRSAREWKENEKGELVPEREIHFTDHGRSSDHPNPHQHTLIPNPNGGTPKRGKPEPLKIKDDGKTN